jgi:hypothetical protein
VQLQDTAEAARLKLACAILDEETDAGAILLYRLLDDSEPSPRVVHARQFAGDALTFHSPEAAVVHFGRSGRALRRRRLALDRSRLHARARLSFESSSRVASAFRGGASLATSWQPGLSWVLARARLADSAACGQDVGT